MNSSNISGSSSGGPERPGNRFNAEPQFHDPRSNLIKQLNELLHQVGQLPDKISNDNNDDNNNTSTGGQRGVVRIMSKNITSLALVICGKADLFLSVPHNDFETDASFVAGPLASSLVQAVAASPLQTPCYAALTLAVQQRHSFQQSFFSPQNLSNSDFAKRTVDYTIRLLSRDLDSIFLLESPHAAAATRKEPIPRIAMRVRLLLRFLALLSRLGIVLTQNPGGEASFDPVVTATNHQAVSFYGLLQSLVQAATLLLRGVRGGGGGFTRQDDERAYPESAVLLAYFVLSTIPYFITNQQEIDSEEQSYLQEHILQPLQAILETYQSDFEPGVGPKAVLLKYEQLEDVGQEGDEADDEDDEDLDDVGSSNQVCDSLQDLNRCVNMLLSTQQQQHIHRFALFSDAPWKELTKPQPEATADSRNGTESTVDEPLQYTGDPQLLYIFPECLTLTMILGGSPALDVSAERTKLAVHVDLGGMVVGRLPVFGSPASTGDGELEEDEMDDGEAPKSERLMAYCQNLGLVDRYFLSEAVRDCVLSHEPKVTDAGVFKGSIKAVAEQVWSIRQMILSSNDSDESADTGQNIVGVEFVVVEVILSLVAQASMKDDVFGLTYLSRVLLELVKLDPAAMAAAIVTAVANIVEDYMPALVPSARYNFSQWFAFHLIQSNYQWPAEYWKHWATVVASSGKSSRGAFVRDALSLIMENLSRPALDLLDQIPNTLGQILIPEEDSSLSPEMDSVIQDLIGKIWDQNEEPFAVTSFLTSDELLKSMETEVALESNERQRVLWRTKVFVRALLWPAYREKKALRTSMLAKLRNTDEGGDEDGMDSIGAAFDVDTLALFVDRIPRYSTLFEGVAAKESEQQNDPDLGMDREGIVLDHVWECSTYSSTLFSSLVQILVEAKIVSPLGILRWSIDESTKSGPAFRWWEPGEYAIRIAGRSLFTVVSDYRHMVIDDDESKGKSRDVRNAEMFVEFAVPLLKYVVERTAAILNDVERSSEQEGKPRRKLSAQGVFFLEGCKLLVQSTRQAFFSSLEEVRPTNSPGFLYDITGVYQESEMSGQSLAQLCSSGSDDTMLIRFLARSLERC